MSPSYKHHKKTGGLTGEPWKKFIQHILNSMIHSDPNFITHRKQRTPRGGFLVSGDFARCSRCSLGGYCCNMFHVPY